MHERSSVIQGHKHSCLSVCGRVFVPLFAREGAVLPKAIASAFAGIMFMTLTCQIMAKSLFEILI